VFTPSHRGGSGPPLVCLHGFTDTWRTWELVLPELERRDARYGVATMCIGFGMAICGVVERLG